MWYARSRQSRSKCLIVKLHAGIRDSPEHNEVSCEEEYNSICGIQAKCKNVCEDDNCVGI